MDKKISFTGKVTSIGGVFYLNIPITEAKINKLDTKTYIKVVDAELIKIKE